MGNHVNGNNTVENLQVLEQNTGNNPFINPQQWIDFLNQVKKNLEKVIEED